MKKFPVLVAALSLIVCASFLSACSNAGTDDQIIHAKLSQELSLDTNTQTQTSQTVFQNLSQTQAQITDFTGVNPPDLTQILEQTSTLETINLPQGGAKIVPIIMFHYVRVVDPAKDPLGYNLSINPTDFEKILEYLKQNGYSTIHVEDLLSKPVQSKDIILTFDDGYEDFYTTALPLLKKYGFTASEAIITGKMDGVQYMTPVQVKKIYDEGIEILCHTVHHTDLATDPNQKTELADSQAYLEKLLNIPINIIVYPSGDYNAKTLEYDKADGYKIGLTTKPGYANLTGDLLELHRIRIDNRDGFLGFVKKLTTPS